MFSKKIKIPYTSLPKLFSPNSISSSYISNFAQVREFYHHDYQSVESINSQMELNQISQSQRLELYNALKSYNLKQNDSPKVRENIDALLEKDCYTVITGQQCGLFTGPLYTIYKAMTCILLAEELKQKVNAHFIPVFWVASEDHDFYEINHISFPNQSGNLDTLHLDIENKGHSVSDIDLDNEPDHLISHLKEHWQKTEFSDSLFTTLTQETKKMSESFVHLMSGIFKDYGLVFVEPYLLRELSTEFNEIAIDNDAQIHSLVEEAGRKVINLGFQPALVKSKGLNLFFYENNRRVKLYPKDTGTFETKNGVSHFSFDELKSKLKSDPHLFSQNVALRPILQDRIFPNVANILGPGEVSYFAQLKGVYELFNQKMPVIYPRASVTLFEKKYRKIQERFHLTIEEILNLDYESKIEETLNSLEDEETMALFYVNIKNALDKVMGEAEKKGKNISDSIKPSVRKIEFEAQKLKEKYLKKVEEQSGVSKKQIERLKTALTPKLKAQERVFNIFYYQNYYGGNIIPEIMNNIDIKDFSHQVLYYE